MTTIDISTALKEEDVNISMDINIFLPIHLKMSSFLSAVWFNREYSKSLFNLCDTVNLHRSGFYGNIQESKYQFSRVNKFCAIKVKDTTFQFTDYNSSLSVVKYIGDNPEAHQYYPVFKANNGGYFEAHITNNLYNFSFIITVNSVKYLVTFDELTIRNEQTDSRHLAYTSSSGSIYASTDEFDNKLYKAVVDFCDKGKLISKVSYEFKSTYHLRILEEHDRNSDASNKSNCCMENKAARDKIIGPYIRDLRYEVNMR
jgi:hypothetical protein